MSIKNLQDGRRSPKRRKLDHVSDNEDSNLSDHSSGLVHYAASKHHHRVPNVAQTNGATSKEYGRNHRSKHAFASKSTILPTGGINKSAILALQLTDLVAEVTPDYDRLRPKWSQVSDQLVSLIKGIPQRSPVTATEATKAFRKRGIRIPWPLPQPTKETNHKFEFLPPKDFVVGGALSQGLSLKHENMIDITAIMPKDVLQEKDYLNKRAFHKAAFYLVCIAEAIKDQKGAEFDISFGHMHDIDLLPVISVLSKDAKLSKYTFRIFVGLPVGFFLPEKTLPIKNCVRNTASSDPAKADQPTPFHNSAICYTAAISTIDSSIRATTSLCPAFEETCRVGQLWLRQRGFSSSIRAGGFGADEWSSICALLLERGGYQDRPLFSKQYSTLQLFKAMLQILAGRDLRKQPMLLLGAAKFELAHLEVPVLYDGKTGVNILYKMSPWSYQSLRHYAQVSLAALNSKSEDSFDATFVLNVAVPLFQYDELYSVKVPADMVESSTEERQFLQDLHSVLARGLGDRITLVDFGWPTGSGRALNQDFSHSNGDYEFFIALSTVPDTVGRLVDHGPSADEQEAAADFRRFWGEQAELRRFKDGSISEALVWAQNTPVTLQIIEHLALLHFKLRPSTTKPRTLDMEASILKDGEQPTPVTPRDAFRLIDSSFQTLTSTLHNLEGLPLAIRSISPSSTALRSTSTLHPLLPSTTTPIDIVIQFDSSTRWPDSLPAIQHTKIAFLLKLSDILNAADSSITTTRVGLENTESASTGHLNTSFLDIIYPSPAPGLSPICFRARIYHDREAHLLQTALQDKSLHGAVRDSLALALARHKRDFQAKATHTLAMRNLMTRFPTLSTTIRLLKTWTSSHRLATHIREEILEIIAAHIFLQPLPFSTPGGSATTAFLRCLYFLARWDWVSTPLTVDLSLTQDGISEVVKKEIETRVSAWRKLDPNMQNVCWVVGTSVDNSGTVWTGNATPSRVVAGRVTALAKAAVRLVEERGWSGLDESVGRSLFAGELRDYDFVVHLKASVCRVYKAGNSRKTRSMLSDGVNGAGDGDFKNLQIASTLDVESIGHDPVDLYLQDLAHAFGSAALFFYGSYGGGSVIAGLWKPGVLGRKEWRVRLGWSRVPVATEGECEEGKQMCVFNREAVLAEMARLGEGLVRDIKVKSN